MSNDHDTENGRAHVKLGLVGPRGVGKTSLVTALIAVGTKSLGGTPVSLEANPRSKARIDKFEAKLRGSLRVGDFESPALEPSKDLDSLEFDLSVDRDPSVGVGFDILDFPGGWLGQDNPPAGYEELLNHIDQSAILLVPIDATYLIEARLPWVKRGLDAALQATTVERLVRNWATSRNREDNRLEPAALFLVPVKCESYLTDNGGNRDRADELYARVLDVYGEAIQAARDETPDTELDVWYCPVDTLGDVELERGEWTEDTDGLPAFRGWFKLRGSRGLSRRGASDLMTRISSYMVDSSRRLEEPAAEAARKAAEKKAAKANKDRGFFGNIFVHLNGKRRRLRKEAKVSNKQAKLQLQRLDHVMDALEKLATQPSENRIKRVGDL